MRRQAAISALLLFASVGLLDVGAVADEMVVSDPRDIDPRGALDIVEAAAGHKGSHLTHTIVLERPFDRSDLDPRVAYVGVAFDTDGDASQAERLLFIFGARDSFRGLVTNGNGRKRIGNARVTQATDRSVVAKFTRDRLDDPDSYRWFAFAVTDADGRCCTDTAPDRTWVPHDIRGPWATDPETGPPGATVPSSTFDVTFTVGDDGGSGVSSWTLRGKTDPSSEWSAIASGTESGAQTVSVPGTEGTLMFLCVDAIDVAGNQGGSFYSHVGVPHDDAGPAFTFSGSWVSSMSNANDFNGTRHTSSTPGDSFDVIVAGTSPTTVGIVAPGGLDGVVRVTVNGTQIGTVSSAGRVGDRIVLELPFPYFNQATNQVHAELLSGTFVVDGFMVTRYSSPTSGGGIFRCR